MQTTITKSGTEVNKFGKMLLDLIEKETQGENKQDDPKEGEDSKKGKDEEAEGDENDDTFKQPLLNLDTKDDGARSEGRLSKAGLGDDSSYDDSASDRSRSAKSAKQRSHKSLKVAADDKSFKGSNN